MSGALTLPTKGGNMPIINQVPLIYTTSHIQAVMSHQQGKRSRGEDYSEHCGFDGEFCVFRFTSGSILATMTAGLWQRTFAVYIVNSFAQA